MRQAEATRKALSGEFGADWESKPDLAATLAALPDVLEYYAPDTDEIFELYGRTKCMAGRRGRCMLCGLPHVSASRLAPARSALHRRA